MNIILDYIKNNLVSIIGVVINFFQNITAKSGNKIAKSANEIQTQISVSQQIPKLLFKDKNPEECGNRFSFLNVGGRIFEESVYITDEIYMLICKSYTNGNVVKCYDGSFKDTDPNDFDVIHIRVNGRYGKERTVCEDQTTLLCISELNEHETIDNIKNDIAKSVHITKNIDVSFNTQRRIIFKYQNYKNDIIKEEYILIDDEQLNKYDSQNNPFRDFDNNIINYDVLVGERKEIIEDKENMIEQIQKQINHFEFR